MSGQQGGSLRPCGSPRGNLGNSQGSTNPGGGSDGCLVPFFIPGSPVRTVSPHFSSGVSERRGLEWKVAPEVIQGSGHQAILIHPRSAREDWGLTSPWRWPPGRPSPAVSPGGPGRGWQAEATPPSPLWVSEGDEFVLNRLFSRRNPAPWRVSLSYIGRAN